MALRALLVCIPAFRAVGTVSGQGSSQAPRILTESLAGRDSFEPYCATCHGLNARGNGPVAGQLRKTPPDLTKYTARNGGVFPSERLRQIIDGHGVAAHGDRAMPVWGDAFRSGREGLTPEAVKARIDAIVGYLGAIQERRAH